MEVQGEELGRVVVDHVIPSLEYAAVAVLYATATNLPVAGLTATERQSAALGIVAPVQLIPSFEYAPGDEREATATYRPDHDVPVPPAYTFARVPSYVAAI